MTSSAPQILIQLLKTYKASNPCGNAYNNLRLVIFHNNEPVNILRAVRTLKDVQCLVGIGWANDLDVELVLRYLSNCTGYSVTELLDGAAL